MNNPTGQSNESQTEARARAEFCPFSVAMSVHAHCECGADVMLPDFEIGKEYSDLKCESCGKLVNVVGAPTADTASGEQRPRRRNFGISFGGLFRGGRRHEEDEIRKASFGLPSFLADILGGGPFGHDPFFAQRERRGGPFGIGDRLSDAMEEEELGGHSHEGGHQVFSDLGEFMNALRGAFGLPPEEAEDESLTPAERRARQLEREAARVREEEARLQEAQAISDALTARIRVAIEAVVEGITQEEKKALRGTSLTIRHQLIFPMGLADESEPTDSATTEGEETLNTEDLAPDVSDAIKSGESEQPSADCTA